MRHVAPTLRIPSENEEHATTLIRKGEFSGGERLNVSECLTGQSILTSVLYLCRGGGGRGEGCLFSVVSAESANTSRERGPIRRQANFRMKTPPSSITRYAIRIARRVVGAV